MQKKKCVVSFLFIFFSLVDVLEIHGKCNFKFTKKENFTLLLSGKSEQNIKGNITIRCFLKE